MAGANRERRRYGMAGANREGRRYGMAGINRKADDTAWPALTGSAVFGRKLSV